MFWRHDLGAAEQQGVADASTDPDPGCRADIPPPPSPLNPPATESPDRNPERPVSNRGSLVMRRDSSTWRGRTVHVQSSI